MSNMPAPPRDLTDDDALKEWKRIAPLLERDDKVRVIDQQMIAIYCRAVAMAGRSATRVETDGECIVGHRNALTKHPSLQVFRDCSQTAARYAKMLGITPEGRAYVKVDESGSPDPGADDDFND